MENYYSRTLEEARFLVAKKATIRYTAKVFNRAKSSVHYDLQVRLPLLDKELFEQVKIILDYNFKVKHIRGGETTRQKYKKNRK